MNLKTDIFVPYHQRKNDDLEEVIRLHYNEMSIDEIYKLNTGLHDAIIQRREFYLSLIRNKQIKPHKYTIDEFQKMSDDELIGIVESDFLGMSSGKIKEIYGTLIYYLKKRDLMEKLRIMEIIVDTPKTHIPIGSRYSWVRAKSGLRRNGSYTDINGENAVCCRPFRKPLRNWFN